MSKPALKEKPKVPPKPRHLVATSLPKPPKNVVTSYIQDLPKSLEAPVGPNSRTHCGADGYLTFSNQEETPDDNYDLPPDEDETVTERWGSASEPNKSVTHEDPEGFEITSLRDVRQRPLPLLPGQKAQITIGMPWFYAVDRRKAEGLVASGGDGCFLIRPSSKGQNSLALTLWYHGRPYNIPIRKRPDGQYALGTPKDLELSFSTIEAMMSNYQHEELVLYSNGAETGRTKLIPRKLKS